MIESADIFKLYIVIWTNTAWMYSFVWRNQLSWSKLLWQLVWLIPRSDVNCWMKKCTFFNCLYVFKMPKNFVMIFFYLGIKKKCLNFIYCFQSRRFNASQKVIKIILWKMDMCYFCNVIKKYKNESFMYIYYLFTSELWQCWCVVLWTFF